MTAAEVTSITINKHSQEQGTAEVCYWNSFLLAKVLHNVFVHMQPCLPSIINLELCNCTS